MNTLGVTTSITPLPLALASLFSRINGSYCIHRDRTEELAASITLEQGKTLAGERGRKYVAYVGQSGSMKRLRCPRGGAGLPPAEQFGTGGA